MTQEEIEKARREEKDELITPGEYLRRIVVADGDRRYQIFFYQLVAYWNEGCNIESRTTKDQHGSSTEHPGYSAAHSAILPNLEDDLLEVIFREISEGGMDPRNKERLLVLGFSKEAIEKLSSKKTCKRENWERAVALLSEDEKKGLIAESTHLYHVANATIEMPHYINEYHSLFEAILRPIALRLLNEVSQGRDPYDALVEFRTHMGIFLDKSHSEIRTKMDLASTLVNGIHELNKLRKEIAALPDGDENVVEMGDKNQDKRSELFEQYMQVAQRLAVSLEGIMAQKVYSLPISSTQVMHLLKQILGSKDTQSSDMPRKARRAQEVKIPSPSVVPREELLKHLANFEEIDTSYFEDYLLILSNSLVVYELLQKSAQIVDMMGEQYRSHKGLKPAEVKRRYGELKKQVQFRQYELDIKPFSSSPLRMSQGGAEDEPVYRTGTEA